MKKKIDQFQKFLFVQLSLPILKKKKKLKSFFCVFTTFEASGLNGSCGLALDPPPQFVVRTTQKTTTFYVAPKNCEENGEGRNGGREIGGRRQTDIYHLSPGYHVITS